MSDDLLDLDALDVSLVASSPLLCGFHARLHLLAIDSPVHETVSDKTTDARRIPASTPGMMSPVISSLSAHGNRRRRSSFGIAESVLPDIDLLATETMPVEDHLVTSPERPKTVVLQEDDVLITLKADLVDTLCVSSVTLGSAHNECTQQVENDDEEVFFGPAKPHEQHVASLITRHDQLLVLADQIPTVNNRSSTVHSSRPVSRIRAPKAAAPKPSSLLQELQAGKGPVVALMEQCAQIALLSGMAPVGLESGEAQQRARPLSNGLAANAGSENVNPTAATSKQQEELAPVREPKQAGSGSLRRQEQAGLLF
ncbi:hypothetical protein CAOG_06985 [Capsaspora owczarzaki ATCC 30864]|uniref:hypothetical protein n=1 Tax=Capsaspora owczarzaki (strain ATCC 30864) TaxID=595528 RepID=UPI0001FE414E|nr:hypothetical protein CAOG_06985 [Capsaspora owczarzaki ATCC 30864]|eukprot:XP_004343709.1 hypothetical protein CAOG_06985 [Capsaspora owczarzaki ATCC 30864]